MPSGPEILECDRYVRAAEVGRQAEAEQMGRSHCNLRIGREIQIQLETEENCCHQYRKSFYGIRVNRIHINSQTVCNHHLLEQAHCNEQQTFAHLFIDILFTVIIQELRQEILGTFNRTGNQLREKCNES